MVEVVISADAFGDVRKVFPLVSNVVIRQRDPSSNDQGNNNSNNNSNNNANNGGNGSSNNNVNDRFNNGNRNDNGRPGIAVDPDISDQGSDGP
jgi:hypothetical protein